MQSGDLHDPSLSVSAIAARLRQDLKSVLPRPIRFSISVKGKDITIKIKGPNLLDDRHCLTVEGQLLQDSTVLAANRYYGNTEPFERDFYLDIRVTNSYSEQEVTLEANRLKDLYWITDATTLSETKSSLLDLDLITPLTEAAVALLETEFSVSTPKKPEANPGVTDAFLQWVEKCKTWLGSNDIHFDRGPKFWRLELNGDILCFVDRIDGTIYKASYRKVMTDSPRGSVFDGLNVFGNRRILKKQSFDWFAAYSRTTGRQFESFRTAWAFYITQRTLRQSLKREPTQEEIAQEIDRPGSVSLPLLDECS